MKSSGVMTQMAKAGLGLILACVCGGGAWGAVLGTYDFNTGPGAVPTLANATYSQFSRTGLQPGTQAGTFASSGFTPALTQDPTQFVQFTLTPDAGYFLTITSMSFDAWHKNSQQGPLSGSAEIFLGTGPSISS